MQHNVVKSSPLPSTNKKGQSLHAISSMGISYKKSHNLIHKMTGESTGKLAGGFSLQAFEFTLPGMPWNISVGWCFTVLVYFPPSAFLPPFPLSDVLCPDHLHMEGKGDTGGLIHCQRHTKAIWALNQTSGLLCLIYERRNKAGGWGRMKRRRWKVERKEGEKWERKKRGRQKGRRYKTS